MDTKKLKLHLKRNTGKHMLTQKRYSKAPITEAILDIKVKLSDNFSIM